eukprot:scaffold3425_cov107-Isochrysis_galbana.AAC.1
MREIRCCVCVYVWCECGWRVVAIDAFPSGLVTATPPTPLRRGGGSGARTCATRRSIRRVARKGVGFGVRVRRRRRRQASPPDCSSSPSA